MSTLRLSALELLRISDPHEKARRTRALDLSLPVGAADAIDEPPDLPGRPEKPVLVHHVDVPKPSMRTLEGRAALLHSLAHIECNAINLALDATWRFAGQPEAYYREWTNIAQEEALHFELLRDHLRDQGFEYGDFPAHNGLWELAEKTRHDLLARMALVPRTMEARGLDASPPVKAKLVGAGDKRAGEILDIILRDEIGHVAVGNHWYRLACEQRGLDPVAAYAEMAERYGAPRPRGPFNFEARRAAGFTEEELDRLSL